MLTEGDKDILGFPDFLFITAAFQRRTLSQTHPRSLPPLPSDWLGRHPVGEFSVEFPDSNPIRIAAEIRAGGPATRDGVTEKRRKEKRREERERCVSGVSRFSHLR